ncbi:MAG: phage GP46 family protein [Roseomonas sp.]|nr:phage GP46 family protein [Roseomonas sp.]
MIAIGWDTTRMAGEVQRTATGALADDDSLATAVLLSLFLDRQADADDALPDAGGALLAGSGALFARRGWIGDAIAMRDGEVAADRIGSRLWLLSRASQLPETLRLAEDYAAEALAWLMTDGLATAVTVSAEWIARGTMALTVQITLPAGETEAYSYALRTA